MKVYTRVVLDMTDPDLAVLEEESFEYAGPVSMCCGGDDDKSSGGGSGQSGVAAGLASGPSSELSSAVSEATQGRAEQAAGRELSSYRDRVNTLRGYGLPGPVNLEDAGKVTAFNEGVSRGLGGLRDSLGGYNRTATQNAYHEASLMGNLDALQNQLSEGNVHFEGGVLKDDNVGRIMDIASVPASFISPVGVLHSDKGLPVTNMGVGPGLSAIREVVNLVANDRQRDALIDSGLLAEDRVEKPNSTPREHGDQLGGLGNDPGQRVQQTRAPERVGNQQPSQARGLPSGPMRTASLSALRYGRR